MKWFIRLTAGICVKYIADIRAKRAIPIVLSPVPRNIWEGGKVTRAFEDYGKRASEAAKV